MCKTDPSLLLPPSLRIAAGDQGSTAAEKKFRDEVGLIPSVVQITT